MARSDKDKKIKALEKEIKDKDTILNDLSSEIESKDKTISEYLESMKLMQADFENYKKRVEREREKVYSYAKEDILVKLLELKDNFERAFSLEKNAESIDDFYKGFEMIYNQLSKILVDEDVKEIDCINMMFDPYYHEALMMDEKGNGDTDIVCQEFQKGYILKDKVIRHSKVKVIKGKLEQDGE